MKHKIYSMPKDYSGLKRNIQNYFYSNSPTRSNIVALAGNNLNLHLRDFSYILTPKSKAYIYDLDINVINQFKHLETKKLILIHDNIINCKIERFIDVDLMATLNTTLGTILTIFTKQYKKYSTTLNRPYYKTFMFTFCLRRNTIPLDNVLSIMRKILHNSQYLIEHKTYRDGAPMCTVQIIWK